MPMNDLDTSTAFDPVAFLATVTRRPGVYRMLDGDGAVIYVGKAKNLRKRLANHFGTKDQSPKQRALIARIRGVNVTVTHTEREALLLENQLIKTHRPRYNINLRDDKSYPYIYISTQQAFPRASFYRGSRKKQGRLFGPYAGAASVREGLKLLQKVFRVRQCQDSFFLHRSRPCLQYQIQRCTAPCVGLISEEDYANDVRDTVMFLEGRGQKLIADLVERMEQASAQQRFEQAARYRDQIATLRAILDRQSVQGESGDFDIVACAATGTSACIQVLFIRNGQQIGDRTFFPDVPANDDAEAGVVIGAFLPLYYLEHRPPREILISHDVSDRKLLAEVLAEKSGNAVEITAAVRGERLRRLRLALSNAQSLLHSRLASRSDLNERFDALAAALQFDKACSRLECFDISHTQGSQTVAACVVFDRGGPLKSSYRHFNIEGITPGDDYAALAQAIERRFRRVKQGETPAPDILFIDGGRGQVAAAQQILANLGLPDLTIVGVAKGPDRREGTESLFLPGRPDPLPVPLGSPARLLIQHIRDEAHRFAIAGHRQRRKKASGTSVLETVDGLGPKRRQLLLKHFGGLREITRAGIDALRSVQGIDQQLAERIYARFHHQDS